MNDGFWIAGSTSKIAQHCLSMIALCHFKAHISTLVTVFQKVEAKTQRNGVKIQVERGQESGKLIQNRSRMSGRGACFGCL